MAIKQIVQRVIDEAQMYLDNDMPLPEYTKKSLRGIEAMQDDPQKGMAILLDGMQEKRDYLAKVKFPGVK
jgi:hypothetical protein